MAAPFDFYRWCDWAAIEREKIAISDTVVSFNMGRRSPTRGAELAFVSPEWALCFHFWENGYADFFGVYIPEKKDVILFSMRILDDASFETTFRECVAFAVSPRLDKSLI